MTTDDAPPVNRRSTRLFARLTLRLFRTRTYLSNWRRWPLASRSFAAGSLAYMLLVVASGVVVVRDATGITSPQTMSDLFIAVGTMMGGILALLFFLTGLILQNAATSSSIGFYGILAKDRTPRTVFWIIGLHSFGFILAGIHYARQVTPLSLAASDLMVFWLILATGFVILLVYVLYRYVRRRIDPRMALLLIEKDAGRLIRRWLGHVTQASHVLRKQPETPQKASLEQIKAAMFRTTGSYASDLRIRFEYLFDYHDRLFQARESTVARAVLATVTRILVAYLDMRRDCSVIAEYMFQVPMSDSHDLLRDVQERLTQIGTNYVRGEDGRGAAYVVGVFEQIGLAASSVTYVDFEGTDNPIFEQCIGNLGSFIDKGVKYQNCEVLFQGARTMGVLGALAVEKGAQHIPMDVHRRLHRIASCRAIPSLGVAAKQSFGAFHAILSAIITHDPMAGDIYRSDLLRYVTDLTIMAVGMPPRNILEQEVNTFWSQAPQLLKQALADSRRDEKLQSLNAKCSRGVSLSGSIWRPIREIAEKVRSAERCQACGLVSAMEGIGCELASIVPTELSDDVREQIEEQISRYLYLAAWFIHGDQTVSNHVGLYVLSEPLARVGMLATVSGYQSVAAEATKEILRLACRVHEAEPEGGDGLAAARVALRACYICIMAREKGWTEVAEQCSTQIQEWHKSFMEALFKLAVPDEDGSTRVACHLTTELSQLGGRSSYWGSHVLGSDSRSLLLSNVAHGKIAEHARELIARLQDS